MNVLSTPDRRAVQRLNAAAQRGFTLVEAIIVIVITGIIGGMVALFIRVPVQGYVDAVARAQLSDVADYAMRRLARDIRLALPNTARVTTDATGNVYLEFLLTKIGLRYLAEDDGVAGGQVLSWAAGAGNTFAVVGALPTGRQQIVAGDSLVVYNLGENQEPANAYNCTVPCNRALVQSVNADNTITLAANPFPAQVPALMSPARRFQVVTTPVTYACDLRTGRLTRYWDYAIQAGQPNSLALLAAPDADKAGGPRSAILADNLVACAFNYTSLANIRNALIGIVLGLKLSNGNGGTVTLLHQVHMDNTP